MNLSNSTALPLKLWRNDVLERFTMMVVGERPSLNTIAVWFEANCKLIL